MPSLSILFRVGAYWLLFLLLAANGLVAQEDRQRNRGTGVPRNQTEESSQAFATLTGQIVEEFENEPIAGAAVFLQGINIGTITGINGKFTLKNIPPGKYKLEIRAISYLPYVIDVELKPWQTYELSASSLVVDNVGIEEINVIAQTANRGNTPVALSRIDARYIQERATVGSQDINELARFQPSVYVSRAGGGYGDSRISVRGFEQENLAVLLNGVPVNDMEFGNMFWVNWMGLSDVTRRIEFQRGIGVSKLAINSVGGTMNIITRTTDIEAGGKISFETVNFPRQNSAYISNYFNKTSVLLNTGLSEDGWAVTFQGSRVNGPGYFENMPIDFWSYFLSISKQINDEHLLVLTAVGAPQIHGENLNPQTIESLEENGRRYNPNWGYLDGEPLPGQNFYHKPQIALNHYWNIREGLAINSSAYVSVGTGGGDFNVGFIPTFDNQINYEAMRDSNRSALSTVDPTVGEPETGYAAQYWRNNFRLDQYWAGLISNVDVALSERVNLLVGIDTRIYRGHQFFSVNNLLGADFIVDQSSVREPVRLLQAGDKLWQDKRGKIGWAGLFGQMRYDVKDLTLFASAAVNNTTYGREDYFQYEEADEVSANTSILAYSAKAGATYRFTENMFVYGNTGYFTRAPFFGVVFPSSNDIADEIVTEKILSAEVGYGIQSTKFTANLGAYYTTFDDKTQNIERFPLPDGSGDVNAVFTGLSAEHTGIEVDFNYLPVYWLGIGGFASFGSWDWTSDGSASISNQSRTSFADTALIVEGLKRGGSPQTSLGGSLTLRPSRRLFLSFEYVHYDQFYADFDINNRLDPTDRAQVHQLPSYGILNFNFQYTFPVTDKLQGSLSGAALNALDEQYYADGFDGPTHDAETVRVFEGIGRTISLGLSLSW